MTGGVEIGLQLAQGVAIDARAITGGLAIYAAQGERAAAIVEAMCARLVDGTRLDELAAAWKAGTAASGDRSASLVLALVRGGAITIVHAGDLAVYSISPRGVRALTSPHVRFDARLVQRVRTRAIGFPGTAGHSELTECALNGATRLVIATVSVWAPQGRRFIDELAGSLPVGELATRVCAIESHDQLAAATARVPRGCAVVELPIADDNAPVVVPVAAQQAARRAIRAVLARTVGERGVVLVGPRGIGKSTVLEQLGRAGMIDASATLVGTSALRRELKAGAPSLAGIVVVDRVLDALTDSAAGNMLAELIDTHRIALVTTASPEDLGAIAAGHKRLAERLTTVPLAPPTSEEVARIVSAWAPRFATRCGVRVDDSAVPAAAELTQRFPLGRAQPEAALFALEQACLRAGHAGVVTGSVSGRGAGVVDRRAVCAAIADQRGVGLEVIERDPTSRVSELAPRLATRLHGQPSAVAKVAASVQRGIERGEREPTIPRPITSLLLLGPTGTGKTETARLLAEYWYSDRRALTTIDLSEYGEPSSVFRLTGAPPGYVGHGDRPPLAVSIAANPHQVVLFDELEKACSEVQLLLLQILDQGTLTTSEGEVIQFRDAIVVLTSNLEVDPASVGFVRAPSSDQAHREQLARHLRPELVARIDEIVEYAPLEQRAASMIALAYFARNADALVAGNRLQPTALPALRQRVLEVVAQFDRRGGARGVLRAVERVLAEDRQPSTSGNGLTIIYPYLESSRERLASGFLLELDTPSNLVTLVDAILTHPAGTTLLYVAHDIDRIITLCGDEAATLEIAHSLERSGTVVTATGRARADVAGRPVGELVDRLFARR